MFVSNAPEEGAKLTRAIVAGVGMIPFKKPDAANVYVAMGSEAARRALADAGLAYTNIQQAYVGYVYGDSTCGQRALYEIGLSGAPIINVNNNCSTGSTALYLARQVYNRHHEYLADGLRLLSPRERAALLLRDVEGLPAEEVSVAVRMVLQLEGIRCEQ